MNRILPAPRAILENRNAVLRYFQKANHSGYACVFKASCEGSSDFFESSGRECDNTRSGAAQRQTQQARHLRHGKRFGQSRNKFLPVMLMQAILHRVPNQVIAASFYCGNKKSRSLEIMYSILTRDLGR